MSTAETMPPATTAAPPPDDPTRTTIADRQRKLLITLDDDGHKKMFYVEDFVGLYSFVPIIALAITPAVGGLAHLFPLFCFVLAGICFIFGWSNSFLRNQKLDKQATNSFQFFDTMEIAPPP
jgi:hypothetical protein